MNILYVTNHRQIAAINGGFISDYLNDLTFHGLFELFGNSVVDTTPIISLYKEYEKHIDRRLLWGGMTSFWLIEKDSVDRENLEDKIKNNYYDLVIYGNIRRCRDYYHLVSSCYPDNKIVVIDGNDDQGIDPMFSKHLYFKRELVVDHKNILPITFSYPSMHLAEPTTIKPQKWATVVPGDKSTYVFDNETDYFNDYRNSFFGKTMKKAGWDCMRHYEIMGNYCLPSFDNIENCPEKTLYNFPKKLISDATLLSKDLDINNYYPLLDEVFDYFKNNLTTKSVAKDLLERIL